MITHKCYACSFEFSQADKAWDKAFRTKKCPECNNPLKGFNFLIPEIKEQLQRVTTHEKERDIFAEVFNKDPLVEFARFLAFLAMLAIPIVTVPLAVLITAFAGSGHGTPIWYYVFLLFTQAIPIVSYSISLVVSAFGILLGKKMSKILLIAALSFSLYVMSFFIIFLISSIVKAMTTKAPYGFLGF